VRAVDNTGEQAPSPLVRLHHSEFLQHGSGDHEVDHLISLELRGSNSFKKLWPEFRLKPL
jgi:hypothetical protein